MSVRKVIGGSLGAIIILAASQIAAQAAAGLLVFLKVPEGICNILAGALYVGFAFLLLKLFVEKLLNQKIEELGMPRFTLKAKWIATAILLPAVVKAIYLLLFSGEYVSSGWSGSRIFATLSAGIAFTGIAAGFVEEMVFRGVILHFIKARWNRRAAVLVPSVLFGFVHIIGIDFSVVSCLLILAAGTMVGIMFSMITIESGSVWNSGIVHAVWNIVIIGGGLAINQSADEYAVMTYVLESKSFVLTGGEFGIEASLVSLAGYLAVTLAAVYMMKKKGKAEEIVS